MVEREQLSIAHQGVKTLTGRSRADSATGPCSPGDSNCHELDEDQLASVAAVQVCFLLPLTSVMHTARLRNLKVSIRSEICRGEDTYFSLLFV